MSAVNEPSPHRRQLQVAVYGKSFHIETFSLRTMVSLLDFETDLYEGRVLPDHPASIDYEESPVPGDLDDVQCEGMRLLKPAGCAPVAGIVLEREALLVSSEGDIFHFDLNTGQALANVDHRDRRRPITGFCADLDTVFFYGADRIFRLSADRSGLMPVLELGCWLDNAKVAVVRSDKDETVFAVQRRGSLQLVSTRPDEEALDQSLGVPANLELVGCYQGLLYFVPSNGEDLFYAAYRDGVEVKRRYVGCGHASNHRLVNGLFFCFVSRGSVVVCVDLSTDTVVFARPVDEINLRSNIFVMPLIRNRA